MKNQSTFSRHRVNAVIALLMLVLLCLACARKVRLSGTVRDTSGRPLVGAITTITSSPLGTAGREEFTADPAGRYSLYQPDGPNGAVYTFRVEVEGYKPFQRTITSGGYEKIEVVLEPTRTAGGIASIPES
ncbi:MAG: carboxypeptidase-like regulatory domain-containing protein, partial [Pyrinomonadaceae bacterium]